MSLWFQPPVFGSRQILTDLAGGGRLL